MKMINSPLVGKIIIGMKIASDKMAVKFETTEGEIIARADADCCSHTWIEHIELPAMGFPAKVVNIESLGIEDVTPEDDDCGCTLAYICKITTNRGELILDYRNESNGYYGGNLVWPDDTGFYGGVSGQNISNEDWVEVNE